MRKTGAAAEIFMEQGREALTWPFGRGESADFKSAISKIRDALRNIPDSRAMFPGADKREFWQRAEDRNKDTAERYKKLGLADYEAIEAFVRYHF